MSVDEPIPSLLSLRTPARRRAARPPVSSAAPQLAFDLTPVQPAAAFPAAFRPIVLTPTPTPTRALAVYTVRQLIAELKGHLEGSYAGLLNVEGEISNCRPAASGHLYFTLKDGDAQLPVVVFRRQAQLLAFKPKDGLAVEARGRISVYESRGQLQLIADSLRPRGTGALQLAFEQLRDRLRREGLFDRPRKPLPPFPHCVGVITSAHGAALHDIIQVTRRRHGRLNLLIYPAAMQGAQCASSVAAGVRWFNRHPERAELILIARGGGSFEDLAGFNDEALARTIAASNLPVVSAIGHEVDHTIADFVADLRAPTPSAAAELITAAQHRIEERVHSLDRRVLRASELHLLRARQRLERLSADYVLARLRDTISLRQQRVDELRFRLIAALTRMEARRQRAHSARFAALDARLRRHDPTLRLSLARNRLRSAEARLERQPQHITTRPRTRVQQARMRLEALSPLAVLNRGYAIVYADSGKILRDAADVTPGQQIRARLAHGNVRATVLEGTLDPTKETQ